MSASMRVLLHLLTYLWIAQSAINEISIPKVDLLQVDPAPQRCNRTQPTISSDGGDSMLQPDTNSGDFDDRHVILRACCLCKSPDISYGVVGAEGERRWKAFLCLEHVKAVRCAGNSDTISLTSLRGKCQTCAKKATFGPVGAPGRCAMFCLQHKPATFVDVVNPTCISKGCKKRPVFGKRESGVALYCSHHRPDDCVDVKNAKCAFPSCTKNPSFGYRAKGCVDGDARMWCAQHKTADMLDLRHRRCLYPEGCVKRACFGSEIDGLAVACFEHRIEGHVDMAHTNRQTRKLQKTFLRCGRACRAKQGAAGAALRK
ncbi:hypothetical protein GUITHDRAFT_103106 [Guillardia theta CCMP2712]|uniref:EsV-1-7 n=1 Tax=Guillardia theta (strain CCMP2712) TaxID=905079 RepID=L1JSM2_GUITC|nr:hypothetical protein GUITHDRAFT_103106 [Guillardia theta CCMP2712]EKX51190.1 hypothetical protein GUITHDRAFT_103106 [Guillardia theta CCMP2712]|eukprot:XP_005838170.1 hypothetical protein GUITHDRAFT_103106 [Guillardia theta CCMP2712]